MRKEAAHGKRPDGAATRDPHTAQKLSALLQPGKKSSFADAIQRLDESPEMVEALRAARLSSRDYLLTVDFSASSAQQKHEGKAATKLPEGLSRDNFDFAQNHPELIKALFDGTKAMLERVRGDAARTRR